MANISVHPDHSGDENVTLLTSFVWSVGLFNAELSSGKVLVRAEIRGWGGGGAVPNATLTTRMIFALRWAVRSAILMFHC